MGKVSKLRFAKLGEVGRSDGSIITGANLRHADFKPLPPDDPLSADTPAEALASPDGPGLAR